MCVNKGEKSLYFKLCKKEVVMVNAVSNPVQNNTYITAQKEVPTAFGPVSNSNNKPQKKAMDKLTQEQVYDPGLYNLGREMMEVSDPPRYRRRRGGFLQFLGRLTFITLAVCGAAVFARKKINTIKYTPLDIKPMKFKHKVAYVIAKLGDWTEETVKGIFKSGKTEAAAEKVAEEVK